MYGHVQRQCSEFSVEQKYDRHSFLCVTYSEKPNDGRPMINCWSSGRRIRVCIDGTSHVDSLISTVASRSRTKYYVLDAMLA